MFEVISLIVGLLVLVALLVLILYYAAKNKQQASFVKQGTIEFVVAGETLLDVLENINDWHYRKEAGWFPIKKAVRDSVSGKILTNLDGTIQLNDDWEPVINGIVPDDNAATPPTKQNGPSRSSPLQKETGFFWVSIWYPLRKIFRFPVTHLRLKSETAIPKDAPLDQYLDSSVRDKQGNVISGDTTEEQALLWKFPRPVLVRDVEFKDLYEANVLIQCTYQIVRPMPFVFEWRERFFPLLEQAVQAAAVDYMRAYEGGYKNFIESGITGSQSPFFWEALDPLNFGDRGFLKEFGVYLRDARVMQIQPSNLDARSKDALKAQKVAELEGDAEITKAQKHATAVTTVATADAAALTAQLTAVAAHPEMLRAKFAVDIARLQIEKAAAIKSGVTWVEGGNALLTIPAPPSTPTPPPAPPTP